MSVDNIAANISSLPTHTPQVKFLFLEVKKGKPNLPLKVEKANRPRIKKKFCWGTNY